MPRNHGWPSLYVNLMGVVDHPVLSDLGRKLDAGQPGEVWELAQPLIGASQDAALIAGVAALQSGAAADAIRTFELLLGRPSIADPTIGGMVVFGFSDEGMVVFDVNSLAGIALLIYAYANVGRHNDAVELAASAHGTVGAEGFLVLQLQLLRDAKRWDDLLEAVETANPKDHGRFETALLKGQALEETGRLADAYIHYTDMTAIDADLPWLHEAKRRAARISDLADSLDAEEDVDLDAEEAAARYDPLRPVSPAHPDEGGPRPTGTPHDEAPTSIVVAISLTLGGYIDGHVGLTPIELAHADLAPATWLALLDELSPAEILERLDEAIAAEPPLMGFRRRPDQDVVAAKSWQRVLAALFAAVAESPDAPERLADVLSADDTHGWVERTGFWMDANSASVIGELLLITRGGAESVVLPLVAKLHARGQITAARAWIDWAASQAPSAAYHCAQVALAFDAGEDEEVLSLTERGSTGHADADAVLQTYRARSFQRLGRGPAALAVLDQAVRGAARVDDDGALLASSRYLRARARIDAGQVAQALDDLHAVEAIDSDYMDVGDLLDTLVPPSASRRAHIPRDVRHVVWQRDGGACVDCGATFDLQYDHIIPVAMGGSSNVENLQLLCGACNRRKSATLG